MTHPLRILSIMMAFTSSVSLIAIAQTNGQPERFSANAADLNRGSVAKLEIVVNRWSTDAERTTLVSALVEKGEEKLLDTLQHAPKVGYIRNVNSIGWDLHYARREALPDGGERVIIATDRPMSFFEEENQPRSVDYPFTVVEIHLNADGQGTGTMSVATKVIASNDKKTIELENFGTTPVLLQSVRREKDTH